MRFRGIFVIASLLATSFLNVANATLTNWRKCTDNLEKCRTACERDANNSLGGIIKNKFCRLKCGMNNCVFNHVSHEKGLRSHTRLPGF